MNSFFNVSSGRKRQFPGVAFFWRWSKGLPALLVWLSACHKAPSPATTKQELPVVPVRVASVETRTRPLIEEIVGTIRAKTFATLEGKISGRIVAMPAHLGQTIKGGDLVVRLDAADVQARREQAEASLQAAERDWNRISGLFKSQAVTRSEFDSAESRHTMAVAALAEADAMLRYAEVRAPFDGVVSRKWVEVGDLASPGKPLVEIQDLSALQLEADLPESIAGRVQVGTSLNARLDGMDSELTGRVAELAPAADPASRTVRVKVDVASAPGLMPGRFARLLVPVGESPSRTIPSAALVQRGQLEMVFVVTNQHAQLHLVKTGGRNADSLVVLSGLNAGEQVVVEGAGQLTDGQPVQLKP